jgi:hypothetical protein
MPGWALRSRFFSLRKYPVALGMQRVVLTACRHGSPAKKSKETADDDDEKMVRMLLGI